MPPREPRAFPGVLVNAWRVTAGIARQMLVAAMGPPGRGSSAVGYRFLVRSPKATDRFGCERGHVFLTLMVIGLVGLGALALPAFGHGHGALSGHGPSHGAVPHGAGHGHALPGAGGTHDSATPLLPADSDHDRRLRFVPSPRAVFSILALYGAFGNAGTHAFRLSLPAAALAAVVPTLLVEWFLVRPLWNLAFRFQGEASSPLEGLVMSEARAVVPFRNGRGVVSTVRDGRRVQFAARLREDQQSLPVKVGDRLLIEEVDRGRERVTVSVL